MAVSLECLDIAVLCGGCGGEREVSLVSGAEVHRGLLESGLKARLVELSGDATEVETLECDLAFIALHGEFGEDGQIQEILERRNIPYTGSAENASCLAMDKDKTKSCALDAGVPVADWVCADNIDELIKLFAERDFTYPVVVKPNNGGSSVGVSIVRHEDDLAAALKAAFSCGQKVMIEEFLAGRELTVGVVGKTPMPLVEMRPANEFYDYHAKYSDERTEYICPAECPGNIVLKCQDYALRMFEILGLRDFARIDFILVDDCPYLLEANSIPGFTSHSLLPKSVGVYGISFPDLCRKIVQMAYERKADKVGGVR